MSDDLIKRSDAWNITAILHSEFITIEQEQILERIDEMIDGLPSADRPQGEWKSVKASIYPYGYDVECSVCGHRMGSSFGYKFCPMCGASMKGADDE